MSIDGWHDDSWRDEYGEDPCDHEDYEINIISGRAECSRCGENWYATDEQVLQQIDAQAAYERYEEHENRRQWWRDLWSKVASIIPRRKRVLIVDDDIPF